MSKIPVKWVMQVRLNGEGEEALFEFEDGLSYQEKLDYYRAENKSIRVEKHFPGGRIRTVYYRPKQEY